MMDPVAIWFEIPDNFAQMGQGFDSYMGEQRCWLGAKEVLADCTGKDSYTWACIALPNVYFIL
jgi:hypothetical protein